MKPNKKTHISFAVYLFYERKGRLLGRYKTLIEAYRKLKELEFTVKTAYDLMEYAELEEQVWADNQWTYSNTIGIYETVGTSSKIKAVKSRINSEYTHLCKLEEAFNSNKIRKRI